MNEKLAIDTALARADAAAGIAIDGRATPRDAVSRATGLTAAGSRAVVSLDADGVAATADLIARAVDRRLPLVVRARLADGHDALTAIADRGPVILFANTAQEAIDLGLVARRAAERALWPVVVADDLDAGEIAAIELPAEPVVRRAIGAPDDDVKSPTTEQQMLFGERRRRLPRWLDADRPVRIGSLTTGRVRTVARAARGPYGASGVQPALDDAFTEVGAATGRSLATVTTRATPRAKTVIVGTGRAVTEACRMADRSGASVVALCTLRPAPVSRLLDALRGTRHAIVLESTDIPLAEDPPLAREIGAAIARAIANGRAGRRAHKDLPAWREKDAPSLHVAAIGPGPVPVAELEAFCAEVQRGDGRSHVTLGVDFAPSGSDLPKRQALLDRLRRDHPGLGALGLRIDAGARAASASDADRAASRAPDLVLPLARTGETHDSLPRFWDQVGALFAEGGEAELSPDPYLAAGTVPPLTSAFRDAGAASENLPALDARSCTGCGACWTACPDGAIGPSWLKIRALIEAGIDLAKSAGLASDALRMLVAKLTSAAANAMKSEEPPTTLEALLRTAYAEVVERTPPAEDRRPALDAALEAVAKALGATPVTAASELPRDPAGQPDVLLWSIDPAACKGCGICVDACEPKALVDAPRDPAGLAAARAAHRTWQALPDTPGASIARVQESEQPGHAAALSLSRHALLPMAGGDAAESGSGPRLALRLTLGAIEAHGQAMMSRRIAAVTALQDEVGTRIRETLSSALPASDLDALADGLHALGRSDVAIADLAARVGAAHESGHVDATALDRLVTTGRALADLRFRLEQGPQGLGRSRATLVIAAGDDTDWACRFPSNPFAIPVAVSESGDARALAAGALDGVIDAWLDEIRLLRRARIELDRPKEAPHTVATLRDLDIGALSDEERTQCPPLVLFGAARDIGHASELLGSRLPVVVLALADADPFDAPDLGLLAMAERGAFVAQCSVARPDHLVDAVLTALNRHGPSLLHVHAPSPSRDGFDARDTIAQAERAITTRAFPLFVYDPRREGVFRHPPRPGRQPGRVDRHPGRVRRFPGTVRRTQRGSGVRPDPRGLAHASRGIRTGDAVHRTDQGRGRARGRRGARA